MSAAHAHTAGHHDASHGSVKSYLTGFALALVLTVVPFWLVMTGAAPASTLVPVIFAIGAVQVLVHLVFFLHINGSSAGDNRWNLMALLLTALIAAIVVIGSIWVIYQSNLNMMPWMFHTGGTGSMGSMKM